GWLLAASQRRLSGSSAATPPGRSSSRATAPASKSPSAPTVTSEAVADCPIATAPGLSYRQGAMTAPTALSAAEGDRLARKNALVLSAAQALYGSSATILITLGGLVGHLLADDKSLAT